MSYYLKYRPGTVAELDLDVSREALGGILKSGRFAHAYLFAGPKGTGKTSSARILAKVLNCEQNREKVLGIRRGERARQGLSEPCNTCSQCIKIGRGASLSVVEIDGASNRRIDDVRQLREQVMLAPTDGAMVVYVIDEVHMLTNEAFNALLKTLEEPPEHAVFVLATTEEHKIPDTIQSRCTKVAFRKATPAEIARSLKKAVRGEQLVVTDEVLDTIARRVDGSFRDGMKILEQLAANEATIDMPALEQVAGFSDLYDVDAYVQAVLRGDSEVALEVLLSKEEAGIDVGLLSERIVEMSRKLLREAAVNGEDTKYIASFCTDVLATASMSQTAVVPILPWEILALEYRKDVTTSESIRTAKAAKVQDVDDSKGKLKAVDRSAPPNKSENISPVQEDGDTGDVSRERNKKSVVTADTRVPIEMVQDRWLGLLASVKPHNHSLEALLKAATPSRCEEEWVVIRVLYTFHKEQLEQERHRRILEEIFSAELGSEVKLRFELGEKTSAALAEDGGVVNVSGKVDEKMAEAVEDIFGD